MSGRRGFDPKAALAKASGLPADMLLSLARPGAVYLVENEKIVFPEAALNPNPAPEKDLRFAIVVQAMRFANTPMPKTVLIVPCTASHRGAASQWNFQIPPGESAFTAPNVVAYASLMQPVLKRALVKHLGNLTEDTLVALQVKIAEVLSLKREAQLVLSEEKSVGV